LCLRSIPKVYLQVIYATCSTHNVINDCSLSEPAIMLIKLKYTSFGMNIVESGIDTTVIKQSCKRMKIKINGGEDRHIQGFDGET